MEYLRHKEKFIFYILVALLFILQIADEYILERFIVSDQLDYFANYYSSIGNEKLEDKYDYLATYFKTIEQASILFMIFPVIILQEYFHNKNTIRKIVDREDLICDYKIQIKVDRLIKLIFFSVFLYLVNFKMDLTLITKFVIFFASYILILFITSVISKKLTNNVNKRIKESDKEDGTNYIDHEAYLQSQYITPKDKRLLFNNVYKLFLVLLIMSNSLLSIYTVYNFHTNKNEIKFPNQIDRTCHKYFSVLKCYDYKGYLDEYTPTQIKLEFNEEFEQLTSDSSYKIKLTSNDLTYYYDQEMLDIEYIEDKTVVSFGLSNLKNINYHNLYISVVDADTLEPLSREPHYIDQNEVTLQLTNK